MVSQSKITLCLLLVAGCVIVSGVFVVPCTGPGKKSVCRRELSTMRGILLAGEKVMVYPFDEWRTNTCVDTERLPLIQQMSLYCEEFSRRVGDVSFNFVNINGGYCLVDPWGHIYNAEKISLMNVAVDNPMLSRFAIGNYLIWSSGPNGKNEHGYGDDIFEIRLLD